MDYVEMGKVTLLLFCAELTGGEVGFGGLVVVRHPACICTVNGISESLCEVEIDLGLSCPCSLMAIDWIERLIYCKLMSVENIRPGGCMFSMTDLYY